MELSGIGKIIQYAGFFHVDEVDMNPLCGTDAGKM